MSVTHHRDRVLVVGGGVSGLALAARLARSGAPVTLLEAESPGAGATTQNQGWLYSGGLYAPTHPELARLCYESLQTTRRFCPESVEPDHDGMLYGITRAGRAEEWTRAWESAGIPYARATLDDVRAKAPMLDLSSIDAAFSLPDRAIRYDILLGKLLRTLAAAGGEMRTGTRVDRLLRDRNEILGVVTAAGEEIRCRAVVLAGNAAGVFLNPRPPESTVEEQVAHRVVALKSHLAAVAPGAGGAPLAVVDAEGFNHIPHGGTSLFGSDRWIPRRDPGDHSSDPAEVEALTASIRRFFPDLLKPSSHLEIWAGITLQAFQPGALHPALNPVPAILDHGRDPRPARGVVSVCSGRASLWPHVAQRAAETVWESLGRPSASLAPPPWAPAPVS